MHFAPAGGAIGEIALEHEAARRKRHLVPGDFFRGNEVRVDIHNGRSTSRELKSIAADAREERFMNEPLQQLIAGLRAGGLDFAAPPLQTREQFEAVLATLPVADDITFDPDNLGGVPGLRATLPGPAPEAALLYLHGGGYIAGSARGYRGLAAEIGRAAGAATHSIDYRLAPEHPFPAAIADAVKAYKALLARGYDPRKIVFAGDSAGGGLTLSMLVAIRDQGLKMPAAALLISPWADLACEGRSIEEKAAADPSLTAKGLRASAVHYLGSQDARRASPIHANLSGLPPLLVQVGSAEILLDDAVAVARAAGAHGVPVQLEIWPDMIHVWHAFAFMLPEGRKAIEAAGAFLRRSLS